METKDCILTRRSIRKYTDEKISKKQLEEIVALAAYAPSWKNTQELPEDEVVAALVAIGFAEKTPGAPPRKEVSELLTVR